MEGHLLSKSPGNALDISEKSTASGFIYLDSSITVTNTVRAGMVEGILTCSKAIFKIISSAFSSY